MIEPTVSAGYLKTLVGFAVSLGASEKTLMAAIELPDDDLAELDQRVPLHRYMAAMKTASRLCEDPAFPMRLGMATHINRHVVVGLMCYSASTMGEALRLLNRYGYLIMELPMPKVAERFQLQRHNNQLWLVDTREDANSFPELTEETWARFVTGNKIAYGGPHRISEIHFTHAAPKHSAEYEKILRAPIIFESDKNALKIEDAWPDIKLSQPNPYMVGILSEHATQLLENLKNAKSLRGRVEGLIIPVLHKGAVSMDWVAEQLGLSRQSLYRKLKVENISFEKLLDALRHQMAINYLKDGKVSINETAYLLGFSDPSAFSRAFKRWTGSRPGLAKQLNV